MSNLTKRVITGVIGGGLMIAIIIFGREVLLATLLALSIIGYFELTRACKVHDNDHKLNSLEVVGLLMIIAWYAALEITAGGYESLAVLMVILILGIMGHMAVYVFTFPKFTANQVMSAFFAVIYCPVMLSFVYLIRSNTLGLFLVWMIFVCSWGCDICAYFVGVKFGKHKMAPVLSPKKSIEGAVGGVVGSGILGAVYAALILVPNISEAGKSTEIVIGIVILSIIGAFLSMVGDLAASAIKRNHDIKDYGKLLPGHGGIMDRFDSVIFVAPVLYLLSLVFVTFIGA